MEVWTERLRLREWRASDREPMAALNADPEVMRFFPAPLDRPTSDAFVDRIERRFAEVGYGLWAVEVVGGPEFIGMVGLNPMPPGTPGAGEEEIGWRLARSAWHQGYATEAAAGVLRVAQGDLGLPRVWSMTARLNLPSIAVMRRIGLTEHSTFEHPRVPAGHPLRPHVAYVRALGEQKLPLDGLPAAVRLRERHQW